VGRRKKSSIHFDKDNLLRGRAIFSTEAKRHIYTCIEKEFSNREEFINQLSTNCGVNSFALHEMIFSIRLVPFNVVQKIETMLDLAISKHKTDGVLVWTVNRTK